MTITDYFKISLKKPELTESISKIIEKKSKLKSQLEICYSRLETIEICNSHTKSSDALILSNFLIVDIINLALLFSNKSLIEVSDNWKEKIKTISEVELQSQFTNLIVITEAKYEKEEEKSEKMETSLSDLLSSIENYIFKKNKSQFENPVDNYKKKLIVQSTVSLILVIIFIRIGINNYQKIKPLTNDVAKIYYINELNPTPMKSRSVTSNVKPSQEWAEVSFILSDPEEVKMIQFEPVHQNFARIQLKELKYLDQNKKVIYERDFKLNKTGTIEIVGKNEVCCMDGLKLGKLLPEKYAELESTNEFPSFYIKSENIKNVKEIILNFRYIKNKERFTD